jgi:hypothetical protein
MSNQDLIVLDKNKAISVINAMKNGICSAILIDESSHNYTPAEGYFGGVVVDMTFKRRFDKAEVLIYLGDPESPVGPYDGKCWIIVRPFPWWRNRWNTLSKDILQSIEAIISSNNVKRES